MSGGISLYDSADGQSWRKLTGSVVSGHVIGATTRVGYYVLAGPTGFVPQLPSPRASGASHDSRNVAVVVGGCLLILLAAGWDVRRRRSRSI
jgi:hypothetical protein